MIFQKYADRAGEWRWRLVADNGRTVADSAEGYASEGNVDRAIVMIKRFGWELESARVEVPTRRPRTLSLRSVGVQLMRLVKSAGVERKK